MAGSLRLVSEPDVWELRVYLGRDSAGRVKHKYERFHGNKRSAQRALDDLVAETRRQPPSLEPEDGLKRWGPKTTFDEAFAAWKENGWDDLSPSTTRRYESIWSVQVAPALGQRRIAEVGPYDIERFFRRLKQDGLAEATVRQTRAVLNRTCRLARRWSGGTLPNPVAETELPTWKMDEATTVRSPDIEEVRSLLAAADKADPRVAAFVRLVTATGMRRGEACALRWSDLDVEARVVTVDESVVAAKGGAIVKAPKTKASVRRVAVDAGTMASLTRLCDEQSALAKACEVNLAEDSFIFSFEPGGSLPPYPDVMSHAFSELRKSAGVALDIHLHSLRHFQATAIDAIVSERQKQARLGWATVHTARHYTDAVEQEDHKAAKHVGDLLDSKVALRRHHGPGRPRQ